MSERDLLWMARRYAHGRHTYAPGIVRDAVKRIGFEPDHTLPCVRGSRPLYAPEDCLCDDCLRPNTSEQPIPTPAPGSERGERTE